jgi:hypothetical protein
MLLRYAAGFKPGSGGLGISAAGVAIAARPGLKRLGDDLDFCWFDVELRDPSVGTPVMEDVLDLLKSPMSAVSKGALIDYRPNTWICGCAAQSRFVWFLQEAETPMHNDFNSLLQPEVVFGASIVHEVQ